LAFLPTESNIWILDASEAEMFVSIPNVFAIAKPQQNKWKNAVTYAKASQ